MKVKPVLGEWEIPHIESIRSAESRAFMELPVPGRAGSLFQDLNTAPTSIVISGSLYSDEKRDEFLEAVRGKFRAGEPVTFVADIVTATDIQYVIIETLRFQESGVKPDQTDYLIVLRESPPPPPPPASFADLDAGLLDQAGNFLDTMTGALDVIDTLGDALGTLSALGNVPDLADPTPPLAGALGGVAAATSGLDETLGPLRSIFGTDD
jgi:hypothetical protein